MAWPDLSDIILRVRDKLNESSASFFSDAQITRWINDGELDVAVKGLCLENTQVKTTTNGQRTFSITCVKAFHVEYVPATGTPIGLVKINPSYLGRVPYDGVLPQYWFKWGGYIGIEPKPAATYTLNVYTSIIPSAEMALTTDEPEIPAAFHDLIVSYAVQRGLLRDHLFSMFSALYYQYIYELQMARNEIITRYSSIRKDLKIPDAITYGGR